MCPLHNQGLGIEGTCSDDAVSQYGDLEQTIRDAPADGPSVTQYDRNKFSSSSNNARPKVFIILILSSLLTPNFKIRPCNRLADPTCAPSQMTVFNRPLCVIGKLFKSLSQSLVLELVRELCHSLGLGNIRLTSVQHSLKFFYT